MKRVISLPLQQNCHLSNWENYINANEEEDPLVIAAVSHYQFEAIHPFMYGNGRIGRILIHIILFKRGYLHYSYLYLSDYFEYWRNSYIDELEKMDNDGVWEEWINFFLISVSFQANATRLKALKMLTLYQETKDKIESFRSFYTRNLLDVIFSKPIISSKIIRDLLPANSNQTIYNLLEKFENAGILVEIGKGKRGRVYAFEALMDMLRSTMFEEIKGQDSLEKNEEGNLKSRIE
ncbi:MAG: Fic family protein [Thermodesulfobacteriota bacterium]